MSDRATRPRGYYWVKFDYETANAAAKAAGLFFRRELPPEHWEVASWDSVTQTWALIGSAVQWYEIQMKEIGPRIEEP